MVDVFTSRREQLFERLPNDIETVILQPSKPFTYFTGVSQSPLEKHGSERVLLAILEQSENVTFVLSEVEVDRIRSEFGGDSELHTYDQTDADNLLDPVQDIVAGLLEDRDQTGKIGMDYRYTRLLDAAALGDAYDWNDTVNLQPVFADLRTNKDDAEIEALKRSGEIVDECLSETLTALEPGMTEREIESELKARLIKSDAEMWGVTLVTSGERTASIMANTSSRSIRDGDVVLVDTGAVYNGYYTDVTRMAAVGDPGEQIREMYEVVHEASARALETVEPGVECREVDLAARNVIEDAGYEFDDRVGHGIGLDGHEPPYIGPTNPQPLKPGLAFTIEPGIYIEGVGGVRIEDNVVVTEDGFIELTNMSRDLIVV
ncbi:M24 family metallopeptidase [Halorussus salinisoli]|uniref:M24 family metallopeptidase n=1 Tax=Halorussus salinisoli TaxID=2558242 RepID=UPI0010C17853|nr:Xaa-Pro peptidase family protein [Halorussus salinisoli]